MLFERFLTIFVTLAVGVSSIRAADLSVADVVISPGATATVVVSGTIAGESTYAVNVFVELVPRAGATGTIVFTPEPPVDISYLGDPWPPPLGGLFSKYDTLSTFSSTHNGSIDDNGTLEPAATTYSGFLSGFPVQASADATGVWDVTLTTSGAPPSNWEGVATTPLDGVITICGDGVTDPPEECDDGNNVDGDCCSATCMIEPCPCKVPIVSGGGSRYLAIRPQPLDSTVPVKLRVDWPGGDSPCLSWYVGSLGCGGLGDACTTNADCNECSFTHLPCLVNQDCDFGLCTDGKPCSVAEQHCADQSVCLRDETCVISGDLCEVAPLATIDINKDGFIDGTLAVLVDEARASELIPSEWTAAVTRCSKSATVCVDDSDCPRGRCVTSGTFCDVFLQNCFDGAECVLDEECLSGAVYVYGEDIVPSEFLFDTLTHVPNIYDVVAECGEVATEAVSTTMWRWADTNNDTYVGVTDIALILLAIQGHYDYSSIVSDDLAGLDSCWVQQILGITDVLYAKRAFQGENYFGTGCNSPTCP